MEEKYLIMVTAQNNNKYYRMIPHGNIFDVEYGRVGASCQRRTYPISQWYSKYNEKINKGYMDKTDERRDIISNIYKADTKEMTYKEIENEAINEIVTRLQDMARKSISNNYTISSDMVTKKMVDEAQRIIDKLMLLTTSMSIEFFNQTLLDLFSVIPRKMSNVNDCLANSCTDFKDIIKREQDTLDVMSGQIVTTGKVLNNVNKKENKTDKTILEALGLEFYEITPEEKENIKKHLGNCSDRFYRAWGVRNARTEKAFNEFIEKNDIRENKFLWHGSRNENFWSIINKGLVLHPTNAVITGKMFGYGIYFALKAQKSLGYSSLRGARWSGGSSSSGFMAVYKVAYGTPYDVYSFDSKYYDFNWDKLRTVKKGATSLHAHAGSMLQNDEIIVYKEAQTTIRYLVELK